MFPTNVRKLFGPIDAGGGAEDTPAPIFPAGREKTGNLDGYKHIDLEALPSRLQQISARFRETLGSHALTSNLLTLL